MDSFWNDGWHLEMELAPASFAPLDANAGAESCRQADKSDRGNSLVVCQVLSLSIDAEPRQELITRADIKFREAGIEIAIGQKQTVASIEVVAP